MSFYRLPDRVFRQSDGEVLRCGNYSGTTHCPDGFICLEGAGANPNYGYTNFDTYGWSIFITIQLFLRDFWEDVLFNIASTAGRYHTIVVANVIILSYILAAYVWGYFAAIYVAGIKRKTELVKEV